MNSYLDVTTKYLKTQKKRTILTIIGVILSVALISALATMIYSYQDYRIDDVKKHSGDYEVSFKNLTKDNIDIIKNHTAFSSVGISKNIGLGKIYTTPKEERKSSTPLHRYLDVKAYDDVTLNKIFKHILLSGRYPKSENEIIVDKSSLRFLGKDIKEGSKITFPFGIRKDRATGEILENNCWSNDEIFEEKNKSEYTIVGIIDTDTFSSGRSIFQAITFLKSSDIYSSDSKEETFQTFMSISSPKNKRDIANQVAKNLKLVSNNTSQNDDGENKSKVQFNNELLRLYGQSASMLKNTSFSLTILFIVSIIIVSTIAVIYNAFNISVLERISQFGILRSVGATPKQIRKIVFKEASIISLIGIPIGIISGVATIKLVLSLVGEVFMDKFDPFKVLIYPEVIIISIVLGTITIFLSALGPALLAGKVSALDAVRNSNSYNTSNITKVSKARISKLLFKIEGSLAYKNLTRNRKRFLITVFSLMISIIMFITFNSFMNFIKIADKIDAPLYFDANYSSENNINDKEYMDIKNQTGIEKVYKCIKSQFSMPIPKEKMNKNYFDKTQRGSSNDVPSIENYVLSYNSKLFAYDKSILDLSKSHIISGSSDEKLLDDMGVILVNRNRVISNDGSNKTVVEDFTNYKVGDIIDLPKLVKYDYEKDFDKLLKNAIEKKEFYKLKVIGIVDVEPLGNSTPQDGIYLITSPKTYKKIIGNLNYRNMEIKLKENANREKITSYFENIIKDKGGCYNDYMKIAENGKKSAFQMSVFVYGFITVITIIGAVNIINTISTSLLIRKREFATLKAIGMSQGQIKKMVFLEGALHGLIAAFLGSIIGTLLSFLLCRTAAGAVAVSWSIPWTSILIATLGALSFTILASILPLRKVNAQNIIENIRAEE
ncbi:ABC transporter permease [Clostridium brassicae]|uniref:FtsX-like permease family protein n=1 Tax=Clostridium brassicae TaxID=2999072 RepID=A0ABT4D6J3_9CLOT|nr:ABC transporter permease [Clostridium brassicae]MCY6957303.1 FtsX-like permease family protein [Clostridium brassicae]